MYPTCFRLEANAVQSAVYSWRQGPTNSIGGRAPEKHRMSQVAPRSSELGFGRLPAVCANFEQAKIKGERAPNARSTPTVPSYRLKSAKRPSDIETCFSAALRRRTQKSSTAAAGAYSEFAHQTEVG